MSTNYVIATWAGPRRNPSSDYLRFHLHKLYQVAHTIDQITIVRPESNNHDFYDISDCWVINKTKTVIIDRQRNDRSYGQLMFAYKTFGNQFDNYIFAEDDYVPNIDFFDNILIYLMERKRCDYLCGRYSRLTADGPMCPLHNLGVIKSSALGKISEVYNEETFSRELVYDGQEQETFGYLFTSSGLKIADYSNEYSVPYYDRYLRYFSNKRDIETIFVPYQLLTHKAFGYHGEHGDQDSHFLSTMITVNNGSRILVGDNGKDLGYAKVLLEDDYRLIIDCSNVHQDYVMKLHDRLLYEYRGREVVSMGARISKFYPSLKKAGWIYNYSENNLRNKYSFTPII